MLGNFNPSDVVNEIYTILDDYETEGLDLYNYGAIDAITDYLTNYARVEYLIDCINWPDERGGSCAVSFVDNGHPQLVLFDYKY